MESAIGVAGDNGIVNDKTYCSYCGSELDSGQEFVYQVESLKYIDDPILLEKIRQSRQYYHGEPLRICKECRQSIDVNRKEIEELKRQNEQCTIGSRGLFVMTVLLMLAASIASLLAWLNQ